MGPVRAHRGAALIGTREADRGALRVVIERAVRPRFSFSIEGFTDFVLERISAGPAERDPAGYVSRLCLDDLYLAVACSRGDDDAWRECRERYFEYIRGFTKRFLHDRAAADVADDVIAELWQRGRFAQYDGRSTLRTWLGAVAAHAAINAGKIERRMTPFEPEVRERVPPGARSTAAEDPTEDRETHRVFAGLVSGALAQLDAEGKLLLLLYYEQKLTLDQMAGVLGTSKPTLSRRLERLRRGLRDAIEITARRDLCVSADTLRERLDFSRLEFDLATALGGGPVKQGGGGDV